MVPLPTDIINRAQWILNDDTGEHFDSAQLWEFFNDAQREIALQVPEASAVKSTLTTTGESPGLVTGVEQDIPSTSHFLIDVPCNTAGGVIERVERTWLDKHLPGWRTVTGSTTIRSYCYNPKEGRRRFQVFPAVASGASIECITSAMPEDSCFEDNIFHVDVVYANVSMDYVLFRALNRLVGNPTFMSRAQGHLQSFFIGCGKSAQSPLLLENPELNLKEG